MKNYVNVSYLLYDYESKDINIELKFLKNDEVYHQFMRKLPTIKRFLKSTLSELRERCGLASLDKVMENNLKYGLYRLQFLVNEIILLAVDLRSYNKDDEEFKYLIELAKGVVDDLPMFHNPELEGMSSVREVELIIERSKEINEVVDLLLSNESNNNIAVEVVPLVGNPGVGKTSLASLVYHNKSILNNFDEQLWLDISQLPRNFENLLEHYPVLMWDDLGSKMRRLLKCKKYLLVLDDFLSQDDFIRWKTLLQPLISASGDCEPGSKILVTSQCASLESNCLAPLPIVKGSPYLLESPLQDECLHLFQSIAFKGIAAEDRDPRLVDIGVEIFNKCASNLHAIWNIASILSYELSPERWMYVNDVLLASIEDSPAQSFQAMVGLVQELIHGEVPEDLEHRMVLKSIGEMINRPLLTCSALFPVDYEFHEVELQQFWEVQGFLNSVPSNKDFNISFEKLLTMGYFIKDRKFDGTGVKVIHKANVFMHEMVKHLVREDYRSLDKPTEDIDARIIQHLTFIIGSSWEAPSWLYQAKLLKSLLFFPRKPCGFITVSKINEILSNLNALEALDLAAVDCRSCVNSIGELNHLRYLRLGATSESLPECITMFQFLRTLDLRKSRIQVLPSGFHKLSSRLRHLYVGDALIDLPPRFEKFKDLKMLDVFIVGQDYGLDLLAQFTNLSGKLKIRYQKDQQGQAFVQDESFLERELHELMLEWSFANEEPEFYQDEEPLELEFLQPPITLKSLRVKGWKGLRFPRWAMNQFHILLKNLVSIHISYCCKCQHLPVFSSLPRLESLQLWGLNALEWIEIHADDDNKASSSPTMYFPSLKHLMMANLPRVKGWSKVDKRAVKYQPEKIDVPLQSFEHLSELRISGCPNLMSMPLVPRLVTLEAVKIHENLLKHLLNTQESTVTSVSPTLVEHNSAHELKPNQVKSSLQVLTVRECKSHRDTFPFHNLTSLVTLEIEQCEELHWGNMMDDVEEPDDSWQSLKSLHFLRLSNISKLESLPNSIGSLTTLKELSLNWLYNLRVLPESTGCLTQLQRLVIRYLPNLANLPESLGNLFALEHVEICYCPKLKQLPISFISLESLKHLEIKECIKLQRRYKHLNGTDRYLIGHIADLSLE